jgi:hypothetical protein
MLGLVSLCSAVFQSSIPLQMELFDHVPIQSRSTFEYQKGACIRAYPRAHQLEGAPQVVFKSQRGQLVEGSHQWRASVPSVPIERDRALPSKPT